ncbi:hypothetical protein ACWEP4_39485 [Streptomyces sp. NPDC004227]
MSEIANPVTPGGIVLLNESFAATDEREGAEIARQVVRSAACGSARRPPPAMKRVEMAASQFHCSDCYIAPRSQPGAKSCTGFAGDSRRCSTGTASSADSSPGRASLSKDRTDSNELRCRSTAH